MALSVPYSSESAHDLMGCSTSVMFVNISFLVILRKLRDFTWRSSFFGPLSNRSVTVTPSHRAEVKAVCWTSDDFRLVSTGQDGATYEYDILKEGRRVSDAWLRHQ